MTVQSGLFVEQTGATPSSEGVRSTGPIGGLFVGAAPVPTITPPFANLSGSAAITLGASANLVNFPSLSGSATITLGGAAALTRVLSVAGTAAITLAGSATVSDAGVPTPPAGTGLVVDRAGNYVVDKAGQYVVAKGS